MTSLPMELVIRAKKGEKEAFNSLYALVYEKLYKLAYYVLQNEQDAMDVLGDAMLNVYESIGQLRKEEACYGWMCKILINECNKKIRHYKRREVPLELVEELPDRIADVEGAADVKEALRKLSYEERLIVIMSAVEGYKGDEIARMLHLKHSTVRSKYRRSINKLQHLMEGEA
ncbi:RNA polymerase sigma-70 factor, ECF subfamily [Lachnospiraceae bacterium KM106-2]|nr:RNA polymerase sigma-70 factor, ECF subfamily [Lachnospiraceae bacterium KM106-2]